MNVEKAREFIEHYGTKGMKWGVRKDRGHVGKRTKIKKIQKLDRKFAKDSQAPKTTFKIYNGAATKFNQDLNRLNEKYKGNDFTKDSPKRQAYYKEAQRAMINRLEESAKALGTNASGTQRYGITEMPNGRWDVHLREVSHAATDDVLFTLTLKIDARGFITGVTAPTLELSSMVDEFIEHYGVKGMKWGKRKSRDSSSRTRYSKAPSKLSDSELAKRITRMETEKKYNQLNRKDVSEGRKFVNEVLTGAGRRVATTVLTGASLVAIRTALTSKFGEGIASEATRRLK